MSKGLLFWLVFLIVLVVGLLWRRNELAGWPAVLLALAFLLGWAVFGFPVQ